MRIVELRVSNFARLTAVALRPDGAMVPIVGANSDGKTSVLRSIWTALKGRAAAPPRPIHEGAEEAVINLDLGELKITRKFRRDQAGEITTDLTVFDNGGSRITRKPQAVLDALLADLSFDPLAFSKMPPKDQYTRLRALVPGVDFDKIARERQRYYDDRTTANRDAKEEATIAAKIALPGGEMPDEVDVGSALTELSHATGVNAGRARFLSHVNERKARLERMREELHDAKARVNSLSAEVASAQADIPEMEANIPAPIDVNPIQEKIASAQRIDAVRQLFRSRQDHERKAADAEELSSMLTQSIADLDKMVVDAIAKSKLPGGLSLDPVEQVVMLGALPFSAAGTADRIVASAKVAMAFSPELRVMLIDEGSELDRAHMKALAKLAEESDYQIWVCAVRDKGEEGVGFVIEDGSNMMKPQTGITEAILDRSKGSKK